MKSGLTVISEAFTIALCQCLPPILAIAITNRRVAKAYLLGAHPLIDPEETLSKVTALMPQIGITRIANVTGLDRIGSPGDSLIISKWF